MDKSDSSSAPASRGKLGIQGPRHPGSGGGSSSSRSSRKCGEVQRPEPWKTSATSSPTMSSCPCWASAPVPQRGTCELQERAHKSWTTQTGLGAAGGALDREPWGMGPGPDSGWFSASLWPALGFCPPFCKMGALLQGRGFKFLCMIHFCSQNLKTAANSPPRLSHSISGFTNCLKVNCESWVRNLGLDLENVMDPEFLKEDGRSCSSQWSFSLITTDRCMRLYQGSVVAGVCRVDGHVCHYRRDAGRRQEKTRVGEGFWLYF